MDFLNQGYARLVDLFKSMTPGARITAALLLTMVVVSLAYLVNHTSSGQQTFLMGGEPFSAAQLPAMEAAFAKANLSDYQIEGNRVRVPLGRQSAYMGALAEGNALPSNFGSYLEKAMTPSPWTSKEQQKNMIKVATQAELQQIIRHMQGIENASVMYDVEEAKGFGTPKSVTASVSIKPLGGAQLDDNQVRMVRNLVANAVVGLKPQNVAVTDLNGKSYAGSSSAGGLSGGADDPYIDRKRIYEKQWAEQISSALAFIPGVVVTANVELDAETLHEESSTDFDPKTVPYEQREDSRTKTNRGPAGGGRPGPAQQHGVNQPATVSSAAGTENNEEDSQTETRNAVPTKQKRIVHSPLTPKRVTVAVSVPSTYYEKVWLDRNPPAAGEEAKKPDTNALADIKNEVKTDIQNTVNALLPSAGATADPFPRVTVTSFQHLPSQPLPSPTMADKLLVWASQYWSTAGMLALALFSLVMLRSMVRGAPATASPSAQFDSAQLPAEAGAELPEPGVREVGPQTIRNRLKRRPPGGPSLREELSELVKEDPDAAVSVLRAWIGTAS
jgi:flagellar M-ring protein FliF